MAAVQHNRAMSLHGPAYPRCFGLSLEQRSAGKPNGNRTLDGVRNRRRGLKDGKVVLAKPRPRGFYYGTDGRLLLKISAPMDLQTSNTMICTENEKIEDAQHLAWALSKDLLNPPHVATRLDSFYVPTHSSQTRTNQPVGELKTIASTDTDSSASNVDRSPCTVRHRDSIEVMHARGRVVKRTPTVKLRSVVRLTLDSGNGKLIIVTPRGYEFPSGTLLAPLNNDTSVKRESKRSSQIWNGYFSPDGTVRTSIILGNTPALPRSAYTDSENEFIDAFTLPKTIYLGHHAYYCSDHEYLLPCTVEDIGHLQFKAEVARLQSELSEVGTLASDRHSTGSYDAALGYLPLGMTPRSKEVLKSTPSMETLHSMDITIGIDYNDIVTSYEAYRPPLESPARSNAAIYRPYRVPYMAAPPSPDSVAGVDLAALTGPGAHTQNDQDATPQATVLSTRSRLPPSWPASQYAEHGVEVGEAQTVLMRGASPANVRNTPLPNPIGVAVLNRAKLHFQRASSESGNGQKTARRQASIVGISNW